MSRVRRGLVVVLTIAGLLIGPIGTAPVRAEQDLGGIGSALGGAAVQFGKDVLWNAVKEIGTKVVVGGITWMWEAGKSWIWDDKPATPNQAEQTRARLAAVETQLREIPTQDKTQREFNAQIANEIEKLRQQVKAGMTGDQYARLVTERAAAMDRRLEALERNDKKQDQRLDSVERELASLRQWKENLTRENESIVRTARRQLRSDNLKVEAVKRLNEAAAYSDRNDHGGAIIALSRALQPLFLAGTDVDDQKLDGPRRDVLGLVLAARGKAYANQKLEQLAMADFSLALALQPSKEIQARNLEGRGDLLRHMNKPRFAREDYGRALALHPSNELKRKIADLPPVAPDDGRQPRSR